MTSRIYGVDFTSAPKRDKPIVVAACRRESATLLLERFLEFRDWPSYEHWLSDEDEWIAGFDFPFGLPRAFVEAQGWPLEWAGMVRRCAALGKEAFADVAMAAFQTPGGVKNRKTDSAARSNSPLKTKANPPVGLMFYEGAWRLLAHGMEIPGLRKTGSRRVALEAFPRLLVSRLGERGDRYKNDREHSATTNLAARLRLVDRLCAGDSEWTPHPVRFARPELREKLLHPIGDWLDAVLCAVQADWALERSEARFGLPAVIDGVEGWIVSA